MAREPIAELAPYCAIEAAMSVLGGKWKMVIVEYLLRETHRFGELRRRLPGITQRGLARALRELEEDGIVVRTDYGENPPRVEYSLTEAGQRLAPAAARLQEWGRWYRELVTAQVRAQ
ncbi:winged helix-turn-helix transcriptional regulator [Sciscionella sediminilitoris]|uniref:winged helix-turn-helix transcriptional regulator n=1 Tax=Sciscionella sediminilitoris TaxID=1445613 RepID=UPI0004DF5A86|nr:helix-turn-helix domain-containing protein [Sciscionella sp. SE31]